MDTLKQGKISLITQTHRLKYLYLIRLIAKGDKYLNVYMSGIYHLL